MVSAVTVLVKRFTRLHCLTKLAIGFNLRFDVDLERGEAITQVSGRAQGVLLPLLVVLDDDCELLTDAIKVSE